MLTYILLRDNKEQGPMRLEDLLEIGLKPYDLVWVPGKSAAWRYPSEIESLQEFAPVVEEQPFDRFYKKENETPVPSSQKTNYTTAQKPAIKTKFITVTMPAGQKKAVTETIAAKPEQQKQPEYNEYKAYMPADTQEPVAEKTTAAKTVQEQLIAGKLISSQAEKIADYTERYERTYHQRKNKWNQQALLLKYGKIAAVAVVTLGIVVIFAFNIGKPEKDPGVLANNNTQTTPPPAAEPGPVENTVIPDETGTDTETTQQAYTAEETTEPPVVRQQAPVSIKEKMPDAPAPVVKTTDKMPDFSKPVKDKNNLDLSRNSGAKAILDKQPAVTEKDTKEAFAYETYTSNNGERSRKVRDNETTKKPADNNSNTPAATKNNSNPFYEGPEEKTTVKTSVTPSDVKVIANEFKVVPFGGIRNLQLTVQNRSGEALEKVVVDVEYMKRDGAVFKTKTVEFKNVGPKSSAVLKIDDTNRGVDVAYHIRKVVK